MLVEDKAVDVVNFPLRPMLNSLLYALAWLVLAITFVSIRLIVVLATHSRATKNPRPKITIPPAKADGASRKATLALFLGSGGHTAEMFRLIAGVNWDRYDTRIYIVTAEDSMSLNRALELEKVIGSGQVSTISTQIDRF